MWRRWRFCGLWIRRGHWTSPDLTFSIFLDSLISYSTAPNEEFIYLYYTSPEISLYKSNTLDWYVIPRDKMKNTTYGCANEGRGLSTLMQCVWIKHLRHIKYAVTHAQCLRPKVEADDRKFKAMKESFDKTTNMYMVIRYQQKLRSA